MPCDQVGFRWGTAPVQVNTCFSLANADGYSFHNTSLVQGVICLMILVTAGTKLCQKNSRVFNDKVYEELH